MIFFEKVNYYLFSLLCWIYLLQISKSIEVVGGCDMFNGYWDENFVWQAYGCTYPKQFTQLTKSIESQAMDNDSFRMLFFGDSNDRKTIGDVSDFLNGVCVWKGDYTYICSTKQVKALAQQVFSIFPYDSPVLNYCVEFPNRSVESRTYFQTNLKLLEHGINEYIRTYESKPEMIEFAINFWEIVRIRQEMICENGTTQEIATKQWNRGIFDQTFLNLWSKHFEQSLIILKEKAKEIDALPFTKTFHLPLFDAQGNSVHGNIGRTTLVKQLNVCIRHVAKKLDFHLLDLERMTYMFNAGPIYLRDQVHYKPFISAEIMNILMYWLQKRRHGHHRQQQHSYSIF